jgi:uncharacterized membrane protein
MEREFSLFFHFIGFGLFVSLNVMGFILNAQYKKAPDLKAKGAILKIARPVGLLSPVAVLIMIITGIGNMHSLGYGPLDMGWLSAKLVIFLVAVILGAMGGIKMKKRGTLVGSMISGGAPADAQKELEKLDKQITLIHSILPILLMCILALAIYGRLGGQ